MDAVAMDLDRIEFRYATVNDAEILADIAVRAFAGGDGAMPPVGTASEQKLFMDNGDYFVICIGSQVIGAIGGPVWDETSRVIGPLFIDPEFHGNGVGSKAVEYVQKTFHDRPIWWVSTPNTSYRNQKFYEKLGFRKDHEIPPDDGIKNAPEGFMLYIYRKQNSCQQ